MDNPATSVIVLAAGSSSRLGFPKQEVQYRGKSLLLRTTEAAIAGSTGPVVVVVGAGAPRVRELLSPVSDSRLHVVENHYWESGMGSSIACGMAALQELGVPLDSVIISLCDQPFLSQENFRRLCAEFHRQPQRIVASAYSGTTGPPVLFPKEFFPKLGQCSGDKGARAILKQHADFVHTLEFPDLAIDIDTPEQLERIRAKGNTEL